MDMTGLGLELDQDPFRLEMPRQEHSFMGALVKPVLGKEPMFPRPAMPKDRKPLPLAQIFACLNSRRF